MRRRRGARTRRNAWFAFLRDFVMNEVEARGELPELSDEEILAWADAHHAAVGDWPNRETGPIPGSSGETWMGVEAALALGLRGFPGGSSLARSLAEHRGRYHQKEPPVLTAGQILAWADDWHDRTGGWPIRKAGVIPEAGGMNWDIVDHALRHGRCGLHGGSSLACLLAAHRSVPHRLEQPRLTVRQILAWADRHHERTGTWPKSRSGPVVDAPGETWKRIDGALKHGGRGLAGGSSLPRLLAKHRLVRNKQALPPLSEECILAWADAYHGRANEWPNCRSGPISEAPGDTWLAMETALDRGMRGLPGGSSLVQLLVRRRGIRNRNHPPRLTERQILAWADAFHDRTGRWPTVRSGAIVDAPGETWQAIHDALYNGLRGLDGGSSLAQLLAQERGVRNSKRLPPLTIPQIECWAEAHRRRTGTSPTRRSGEIPGAPGETWSSVDRALRDGRRCLPARTSLSRLLTESPITPRRTQALAGSGERR